MLHQKSLRGTLTNRKLTEISFLNVKGAILFKSSPLISVLINTASVLILFEHTANNTSMYCFLKFTYSLTPMSSLLFV